MLSQEDDIDANALFRRGWTISAIARHLGRDRKTIRAYVTGVRTAGVRMKPADAVDAFAPFEGYVKARFADDPHVWAVVLFDEVVELGYPLAYATFTRHLRERKLRPHCEPCSRTAGRAAAVIEHPPGDEVQWDWVELPDPPAHWDYPRKTAYLLVGALSHSGRWRGVLCENTEQPLLVDALDRITRALGGVPRTWRFDRMATVCHPDSGKVTASFTAVAKHYGVSVAICPPRSGNRKGVVEKANHTAAQRWWRTVPDEVTVHEAQARLDTFCARVGDARVRTIDGLKATVGEHAGREMLAAAPTAPYQATITVERVADAQCLVSFRGNRYSVPPELARTQVTVSWRLGSNVITVATAAGTVIAKHERAPDGAGALVRTNGHVIALEKTVLGLFDAGRPHRRKERIPPGAEAVAAAEHLKALRDGTTGGNGEVVIDLNRYADAAAVRTSLPDTESR